MAGLSANIDIAALPRAFDPRCDLQLEHIHGHLIYHGMVELLTAADMHVTAPIDQPARVVYGLRLLGRALRGFAAMGHRCKLPTISARLSRHASLMLFELNATNVHSDEHGAWELRYPTCAPNTTNETHPTEGCVAVDIGSALHRASRALVHQSRFRQAGFALALALVYAAGGDDGGGDEPLAPYDVWGGFSTIDPNGNINNVQALEEHFRALRQQRLQDLVVAERVLAERPAPALMSRLNGGEEVCCCCWALQTEQQEAQTNTGHVF
jgi:hypothetical protein